MHPAAPTRGVLLPGTPGSQRIEPAPLLCAPRPCPVEEIDVAGDVPISFSPSAPVRRFPVSTGGLLPFKGPVAFGLPPTASCSHIVGISP